MKNQLSNQILIGKNSFLPYGEKMIPAEKAKRPWFIPEFARFKAGVWWADTGICSPFPSYECAKNMTEEQGYDDLMRRVVKGKNPNSYTSIVLYMAIGTNLKCGPNDRNHNYEICCYTAGQPARTERKIIFDRTGKVDINATIEINK